MTNKNLTINGTKDIVESIELEFIPRTFADNYKLYDDAKKLYIILRTKIPAITYEYLKQLMEDD